MGVIIRPVVTRCLRVVGTCGRWNLPVLFGSYVLDTDRRELKRGGELIQLEPQVFDLLVHLVRNRDRVVSKDDLIASVWGGRIVSESTLTSRINAVRRAVGDSGEEQKLIRTLARKGFRFVGDAREQDPSGSRAAGLQAPFALPDRPSIAVLPFTNMSGDPQQDYFIDGIAEEIITALSRVRWFFVIARHSSFAYRDKGLDARQIARDLGVRYVLVGSVRRAGDQVRISAQLIEGSSGNNVWARSYDRAAADIFAVQDEITQMIVGAIEPQLSRAERERARVKPRDSLDAWSTYQRGMFHLCRCTREDLIEARKLFRQATALDAELGPAYSAEAEAYYYEVVYGFADCNDENREKAIGPAHRAVTLDAEDAGAHCTLGRIRYLRREYRRPFPSSRPRSSSIPVWRSPTMASARHWSSPPRTRSLISNRRLGSVRTTPPWGLFSCGSRMPGISWPTTRTP